MSFERMKATEDRLQKEIKALLQKADAVDRSEDSQYGEQGRGDWKLEGELARREERLARIAQARRELEAEAAAARARELAERAEQAELKARDAWRLARSTRSEAEESAGAASQVGATSLAAHDPVRATRAAGSRETDEAVVSEGEAWRATAHADKVQGQAEQVAEVAREKAAEAGMPEPDLSLRQPDEFPRHQVPNTAQGLQTEKAQRDFTDSDSRIIKRGGEFIRAYNCQAAVDSAHQIIVEIATTNQAPDPEHLIPTLAKMKANFGALPEKLSADTGYWSDENAGWCAEQGIDAYIAKQAAETHEAIFRSLVDSTSPSTSGSAGSHLENLVTINGITASSEREARVALDDILHDRIATTLLSESKSVRSFDSGLLRNQLLVRNFADDIPLWPYLSILDYLRISGGRVGVGVPDLKDSRVISNTYIRSRHPSLAPRRTR